MYMYVRQGPTGTTGATMAVPFLGEFFSFHRVPHLFTWIYESMVCVCVYVCEGVECVMVCSDRIYAYLWFLRSPARARGGAQLLLANLLRDSVPCGRGVTEPDTMYKTPFHASFRTSMAIPDRQREPRPGRICDRSWWILSGLDCSR